MSGSQPPDAPDDLLDKAGLPAPPLEANILVVDDDAELRSLMAEFLEDHGFRVYVAGDAVEMDAVLARRLVHVIVLDIMMPGEDGLSVLRRLDGPQRPGVIVLSAMGDDLDRITGLELGADDYLSKPFSPREMLARIRGVLRCRHLNSNQQPARRLRFGDCVLDLVTRRLQREGRSDVQLTVAEFRVLNVLLQMPLKVLTRDQLVDATRGEAGEMLDRTVDVMVSRLRRKLGAGDPIRTVRNKGYMLATVPEVV